MAVKLDAYDFNAPQVVHSLYPWAMWCDGSIWRAVDGRDYNCRQATFVASLRTAAAGRRMDVRIRSEDLGVVFQFIPDRSSAEFVHGSADPEVKDI